MVGTVKLSGIPLSPEVFGDRILKRNTWNGTGYEKAVYTNLKRPVPPWSRERMGPGILPTEYPNIDAINKLFASVASRATVDMLHTRGLKHKKFLKYRARVIGQYVKNRGRINVEDILPPMVTSRPAVVSHTTAPRHIEF